MVKFGKRLQSGVGDDWVDHYVSYTMLKRLIEKCTANPDDTDLRTNFFKEVTNNVDKVNAHFETIYAELVTSFKELVGVDIVACGGEHEQQQGIPSTYGAVGEQPEQKRQMSEKISSPSSSASPFPGKKGSGTFNRLFLLCIGERLVQRRSMEQRQFRKVFRLGLRLVRYVDMNREAVRKALKKFDKNMNTKQSSAIMKTTDAAPFVQHRVDIIRILEELNREYEKRFGEPIEKYGEMQIQTGGQWVVKWFWLAFAFIFLGVILVLPILTAQPDAHRCLALLVCVLTLWLTEAIPFFCTAMFIPLLAVWLQVLSDLNGNPMTPMDSAQLLLGKVFGHTQVLVLGGLVMAKAIAKHKLEERLANVLQTHFGHYPSFYMLGIMMMGLILSSFVSNIAAPVLVLSVIQTTLWDMPSSSGAPQAILLGLAISCNFGGMMTPISSPQNAVALQVLSTAHLQIGFSTWFALATPICVLGVIVTWLLLLLLWKPFETVKFIPSPLQKSEVHSDPKEMWLVIIVCCMTVVLWIVQPLSDAYFGDSAMVALFPIVVFFGVGVLSKDDFNTLSWHLLFLLAGGGMLGLCAHRSHLVEVVMHALRPALLASPPYLVTLGVVSAVGVITSFISHTVGAMILLPVVLEIGNLNPTMPDPRYLVFASVTMCSGAMAFPITSFPNVNSLLAEDDMGRPYLLAKHFLVPGMVMTLFVLFVLVSVMDPYMQYILKNWG